MSKSEILSIFANNFVHPSFRERFLHEASKRPEKLAGRICHNIEDIFPASFIGARPSYDPSSQCFVLKDGRGFLPTSWGEAARNFGLGDGCLVIDAGGGKFYAETEAMQGAPSVSYGSGA